MIVAELRIVPLGEGTSMHDPMRRVADALEREGLKHEIGPMGTTLEGERIADVLHAVEVAHLAAREGAARIVTELAIDDRLDKDETARTLREI